MVVLATSSTPGFAKGQSAAASVVPTNNSSCEVMQPGSCKATVNKEVPSDTLDDGAQVQSASGPPTDDRRSVQAENAASPARSWLSSADRSGTGLTPEMKKMVISPQTPDSKNMAISPETPIRAKRCKTTPPAPLKRRRLGGLTADNLRLHDEMMQTPPLSFNLPKAK